MRVLLGMVTALAVAGPGLAEDATRGGVLYAQHCAVCHGSGLNGDGPMAGVLVVPPPDLTRISERYQGFPRIRIARIIDGRDPLLSHGGDMPIYGYVFGAMSQVMRMEGGPTLLTAPEVVDLVAYLETRQRP